MNFLVFFLCQDEVEVQQPEESNPYEEVYKDSSTFLKVGSRCHFTPCLTNDVSVACQKSDLFWKVALIRKQPRLVFIASLT